MLRQALFAGYVGLLASSAAAFYLPGVAPTDYHPGDSVPVYVNTLTPSGSQQLKSVIPYDYYRKELHFCEPKAEQAQGESLGSILFGDRLYNSPYNLQMLNNQQCLLLCNQTIPKDDAKFINDRIREKYSINWLVDGLPAATKKTDAMTHKSFYSIGFALGDAGAKKEGKNVPSASGATVDHPHFNNHYEIEIRHHQDQKKRTSRIVGVLVYPRSRQQTLTNDGINCGDDSAKPVVLDENADTEVHFTYSVHWVEDSSTTWATRWDNYFQGSDSRIHWFSLVNSIIIVLFLTGMVAMILLRALHKDISRYNQIEAQEDVQEDSGWKLVHGDVFRPPAKSMFLSVMVGSGAQLLSMALVTLVFAVLGFLSPSNRGMLVTVMILFYLVFAYIAGYVSARLYKMFGGESWKKNVVFTSLFVPSVIFSMFLFLNFFLIGANSSAAVPVGTMFAVIGLWLIISAPSSFLGSYFGFKKPKIEMPVRTNQIPRQIPEQVFYLRSIPSMLMGGILPFGAIFIELYFIMNSVWGNRLYYLFGFAALVFVILIVTCSEVTILMCYFHLCAEDYHWWWRSFCTSGASAFYVLLYGCVYYFTKLEIDNTTSTVLYFGWTTIISFIFFTLTGTIGFAACFFFTRKIYGSIKID